MSLGLLGEKIGMTRIFTDDGVSIPVTVICVNNNRVIQIKNVATDGYSAVQVAFGKKKASRTKSAIKGHYKNAGVLAGSELKEFLIPEDEASKLNLGDVLSIDIFEIGQLVDIVGISIGKGYAGVIKRHNFSSNRASHGNSRSHNTPGSIGQRQDPGKVFKGKKMSGHLGAVRVTIQNLVIAGIDYEHQLLLIKGAVPGAKSGAVRILPSIKKKRKGKKS